MCNVDVKVEVIEVIEEFDAFWWGTRLTSAAKPNECHTRAWDTSRMLVYRVLIASFYCNSFDMRIMAKANVYIKLLLLFPFLLSFFRRETIDQQR